MTGVPLLRTGRVRNAGGCGRVRSGCVPCTRGWCRAYDIIYGSFVYISYDGEHFYTNATNANYVLSYGMIPALDYEGEGLEEIKLFLEKYKDLVE